MPKYWGKQIFSHGSFPEVGEKQKAEKKKVGENNGQLCFVRHHGWRTQASLDQYIIHGQELVQVVVTERWPISFSPVFTPSLTHRMVSVNICSPVTQYCILFCVFKESFLSSLNKLNCKISFQCFCDLNIQLYLNIQ